MMALLNSRMSEEARMERDRVNENDKEKRGKRSLTEEYMEQFVGDSDPLAMTEPTSAYEPAVPQIKRKNPVVRGASPDGHAAVPGLLKPRQGIGRK